MVTSSGDDLIGQQLGDYVIDGLLGVGGMAKVYRAHDQLLHRDVAIKALLPVYLVGAGHVERFRREAQRVAALDHPHIVPILHFIDNDQGLFLVMPLYAESLRERLKRELRLSLAHALQIVKEIGSALSSAHAHGLIHRDVKPGNILLDDQGHASLADFGVAHEASSTGNPDPLTLAGAGLTAGTPQYMAPEQLREADLDARADLYALGVVLYEMLTGRTPHLGDSQFEVGAAVLSGQIIRPSAINPDIPHAVEDVLMHALSLAAVERYATVQGFVEALEDAVAHPARIAPDPALLSPLRLRWRSKRNTGHTHAAAVVGHAERIRRGRWLALELLALTALLAVGGAWIALTGEFLPSSHDGTASRVDAGGGKPTVTQITPPTVTVNTTASSAPTATIGRQPTTTPAPSATASPPPLLTLGALHLIHVQGNQCAGAQNVANSGAQQMTWQWASIQPSAHSSFLYGVNTTAQFGGLPTDQFPGVAAGASDTLNVQMRCTGQSYTVTLRDGLGRTQQFTMISD
jgi:serine/threonine-protein kinase